MFFNTSIKILHSSIVLSFPKERRIELLASCIDLLAASKTYEAPSFLELQAETLET